MFGEAYFGQIGFAEVVAVVETPEGQVPRCVFMAQFRAFDFESGKRQTVFIAQPKARDFEFVSCEVERRR